MKSRIWIGISLLLLFVLSLPALVFSNNSLPYSSNWKLVDNTIRDEVFNTKNNHNEDGVVTQINHFDELKRTDEMYGPPNHDVVVIDPGHGGEDFGFMVDGKVEKQITLAIAQATTKALEKKGFTVYLTREGDRYLNTEERARFANQKQPIAFLSFHLNYFLNPNVHGLEVLVGLPCPESILKNPLLTAFYLGSRILSLSLSNRLSKNITARTGQENRGVIEADIDLIHAIFYPSCCIYLGFLSNPKERSLFMSTEYQQQLTDGIVETILEYLASHEVKHFLGE